MSISILIADDHAVVRQSLRTLLETQTDFTILGEARDGVEAVELSQRLQPDVLILDIAMPRLNGLEALPRIRRVSPRTRNIIFSNHTHPGYLQKALSNGAVGYVLKHPEESHYIVQAIRQVVAGEHYISQLLS